MGELTILKRKGGQEVNHRSLMVVAVIMAVVINITHFIAIF